MATTRARGLHQLTAVQVQQAGDGDHSDGGGLRLRVQAERAQWVLRFTSPSGRRREMGLGAATRGSRAQAGETLQAARDLAQQARVLLRQGVDPIDQREGEREAARAAEDAAQAERARERWTLARCARDYHERVIEPTRTAKHGAQWISSLENHVPPALWAAPIDTITPPVLLSALLDVKAHPDARRHDGAAIPETLRRIRQRLEAVFEDACFHGRCAGNPAAAIKRKLRESGKSHQVRGQFKALPYREAPALLARLRTAEGTAARALEFAVLCAARTGEVIGAEWSEICLESATWALPGSRMKAGEPHTVYLSHRAVEILCGQLGQDARWVFPSPATMDRPEGRRTPLSNMSLLSTLGRLDVRDRTTVHGLARATFSTWANETAAARPDVIEACLAHREGDRIRASYMRSRFNDERRALLAAWDTYLQGAQVISLRRAGT